MICIVSGTNRPGSNSIIIANEYQKALTELGEESQIINLQDLPQDFIVSVLYKSASEGKHASFTPLQEQVNASDKFVFIIPEYNGSFPGILKSFVDGLEYPESFRSKKGAVLGISNGTQGAAMAMSHFADVLNYLGMHTLALRPRFTAIGKSISGSELVNESYRNILIRQAKLLAEF